MKQPIQVGITMGLAALLAGGVFVGSSLNAAEGKSPIKEFMKQYHKAPKGVDPICKRAGDGKATDQELASLVAGYTSMCAAKPPRGDEASWKEKTTKLLDAARGLQKHSPDAIAQYKEAVNCKACHSQHKPE
jgi:hypothetical protein